MDHDSKKKLLRESDLPKLLDLDATVTGGLFGEILDHCGFNVDPDAAVKN